MSLGLTRKTDYALVALASLAQQAAADDQPLSARQIATMRHLPLHLLMNVLKRLHAAGLVHSRRGSGGGYWPSTEPDRIRVAQVVEAIEGPVKLAPCCEAEDEDACLECASVPRCPISGSIRQLNGLVFDLLQRITLKDLMKQQPIQALADQADPVHAQTPMLVDLTLDRSA